MKRILAILMALMLLLSLAACGGGEEETILGKWKTTIDLADYMDSQVDDQDMKKYIKIDDFDLVYYFTFEEDGTYHAELDDMKAMKAFDKAKETFKKGAKDYLQAQIDLAGGGVTVDELLSLSGTTLDTLVDQAFGQDAIDVIAKAVALEGEYKIEGEKLFLTADADAEFAEEEYCTFKLGKGKLTIEEGTSDLVSDEDFEVFPLEFKREAK